MEFSLVHFAIPAFLLAIALELGLTRRWRLRGYEARDTAASLAMGVGNVLINLASQWIKLPLLALLYEHRLFDLGHGPLAWVAVFVVEDFTYYWFHRASHEVRFLWAAHVNHHSSERYNLSTALRQSWTTPFTTFLFYWPLPLLGFDPFLILTATSVSLLYQFWIHTECIDRLGWLERWFNTPSHHRVHHGSNLEYLDRNHGGILIAWDRWFGTFEAEQAPVRYGLTKNIETFYPWHIAFHEWRAIGRDLQRARNWRERLGYIFAAPGWSPDGSTQTARQLRQPVVSGSVGSSLAV
ncbi:MAG TPA: sterol desaturase family protein [Terriglobales bacterium]|nr:sterol desaturase family protein [Terriglobales bacterium]